MDWTFDDLVDVLMTDEKWDMPKGDREAALMGFAWTMLSV